MKIHRALSIAGSAARGAAGVQADIKTFQELDVYGMSAITAIVAGNPRTGQGIYPQPLEAVEAQIHTALNEVGADAVKTGMLFTEEIIRHVSVWLKQSGVERIVIDPVIFGKMGSMLLKEEAVEALKAELIPIASILTPNMEEASWLLGGRPLVSAEDLKKAARDLHKLGPQFVLVKGGRLTGPAIDVLYDGSHYYLLEAPRIHTNNTNGAGCTYAAAITAELAKGRTVLEAAEQAKKFITAAIRHAISFGKGVGPTCHSAYRKYDEAECRVTIET